jgi:hypothetical protein
MHLLRRFAIVGFLVFTLFGFVITQAQEGFVEFRWYESDLALRYPSDWQSPSSALVDGRPTLTIVATSEEGVVSPTLIVSLDTSANESSDLYGLLDAQMKALGIAPSGPLPIEMLEVEGIGSNGISADGEQVGIGRVVLTEQGAISLVGRSPRAERETFTSLFNSVANSLLRGADSIIAPLPYGVVWYVDSYPDDGEDALLDLRDVLRVGDELYVLDEISGIMVFSAETGAQLDRIDLLPTMQPSAFDYFEDQFYVADVACGCIQVLDNGSWQTPFGDFGLDAPANLAITDDGTIYATDTDDDNILVRAYVDGEESATYAFETPLDEQPFLIATPDGNIRAITRVGDVFGLEGVSFASLYTLNSRDANFVATDTTPNGEIAVSTEQSGIIIFDGEGEIINRIGRIVVAYPLAGELVAPRALYFGEDGTLYWVDSDGSFGAINAVSPRIEAGRVGTTTLTTGNIRQGTLNNETSLQVWTIDVVEPMTTDIRVIADALSDLDVALRIVAPDGNEVLYINDDETGVLLSPTDVLVEDFAFEQVGIYSLIVERISGVGQYALGLAGTEPLPFDSTANNEVQVSGSLEEARISDSWTFEGTANLTLTITMSALDDTLDPLLRVFDAQGTLLFENDDAENPDLFRDAQIVDLVLPRNGIFTIEATRFDGQGRYELTVEVVR